MNRWAIWIDIEGFSQLYDSPNQTALVGLRALMEGILKIGTHVFPDSPKRLFAHQLADGFVIVSELGESTPERPLSIAVLLMQYVLQKGGVVRTAISHGGFADVMGCYPKTVREAARGDGCVRLGRGIMTLFPVMGTGLINAYRLSQASPKGACLLIEKAMAEPMAEGWMSKIEPEQGTVVVDWVHSRTVGMGEMAKKARMPLFEPLEVEKRLLAYIRKNQAILNDVWIENTLRYVSSHHEVRPAT